MHYRPGAKGGHGGGVPAKPDLLAPPPPKIYRGNKIQKDYLLVAIFLEARYRHRIGSSKD